MPLNKLESTISSINSNLKEHALGVHSDLEALNAKLKGKSEADHLKAEAKLAEASAHLKQALEKFRAEIKAI